jgi:2,5-dihydroxypyridine 5,6-dioxygenase
MEGSTQIIELIKNVKVVFDLNCKLGDSVLIVTDSLVEQVVWTAIATAGRLHGCEVTVAMMADPRESHRVAPPKPIIEAIKTADLTISATSKEFHTGGHYRLATDNNHKFLIMEEVTSDILLGPAVKADYYLMNEAAKVLRKVMDRGGSWHITSESGCDFRCETVPNTGRATAGQCDTANIIEGRGTALADFPGGEFGADPVRGSGNGVMVWDASVHYPRGLLSEPIILTIKDGKVVKIEGGKEAQKLKDYMKQHCDGKPTDEFDNELSIGFNPKVPITGVLRTDKKHYGKIHTAIGRISKGQIHIDGVTQRPTISVNGKVIVKDDLIMIPPLDGWVR